MSQADQMAKLSLQDNVATSAVTTNFSYCGLKRGLDIFVSFGLLIFLSPVLLLIALLIKLDSPGPVLYRQQRCTLGGKTFWMRKFRSMPHNTERDGVPIWGAHIDPRSTRLGRWLRILGLDELPQLFNILRGEMSLVGPRPERPYFIQRFRMIIKDYDRRHAVKAGLTGWAQVNGYRGTTSVVKRVEYDLQYIDQQSFLFDSIILLKTPFCMVCQTPFLKRIRSSSFCTEKLYRLVERVKFETA